MAGLKKKKPGAMPGFFVQYPVPYAAWMFDACLPFGP
ncbi:hypothetical protein BamIOP4010DRAFT_0857 [Burkholderia ambifaria IOP40-10]|uniref:Uncharacterized protein n=1 Tax=Burkholderia ambifaria IOP40-10 TaxID=396596 RepID=B1F9Z8_9BURK|nr:hypothetical protein BamIOP4010DRAFT_0857 [Burkholderia ambifaria IOP40-10]